MPSEEEKQACLQRVAEGQGSNIKLRIMKKCFFFAIVASMLVLTSCPGPDPCELVATHGWRLPKELNQFFPYEIGQRISFENNQLMADTLVFEVSEVHLLEYDTAYYSSWYDPCHPTGELAEWGVTLTRISGQDGTYAPKTIRLVFGGGGIDPDGQKFRVNFIFSAIYDNMILNLESPTYTGEISNLEDSFLMNIVMSDNYNAEPEYAQIVKDKGLTVFSNRTSTVPWQLIE